VELFSWGLPPFANREQIELQMKETWEHEPDGKDVITNDVHEFKTGLAFRSEAMNLSRIQQGEKSNWTTTQRLVD
jgi:hypothetical protein